MSLGGADGSGRHGGSSSGPWLGAVLSGPNFGMNQQIIDVDGVRCQRLPAAEHRCHELDESRGAARSTHRDKRIDGSVAGRQTWAGHHILMIVGHSATLHLPSAAIPALGSRLGSQRIALSGTEVGRRGRPLGDPAAAGRHYAQRTGGTRRAGR